MAQAILAVFELRKAEHYSAAHGHLEERSPA